MCFMCLKPLSAFLDILWPQAVILRNIGEKNLETSACDYGTQFIIGGETNVKQEKLLLIGKKGLCGNLS